MDTVKSILSSRGVQAAVVGMGVAAAMKYAENNRKESDTCEIAKKKFDDDDEPIPVLYEGEKLNQARVIWFQSPPDVVILHQFPRGRNVLSLSPFPIKLETFLRIHNIKYTNDFMFPYSPDTQKSPWITIDREEISDSQLIIEFLARKFGIDLSYKLSPREKGIALSFRHLLEHHFYWIMIVERYVDQEARHLKDIVQKSSENDDEHAKNFEIYRRKAVKKMTTQAYNQGMGRLPRGELQKMGIEDLQAISSYLSNKTYVMGGDSPTDIDLVLFGFMCSIIYASPQDSPFKTCVEKRLTNLLSHMKNMKAKYFPDWDSLINQPVMPEIGDKKDSDPKPQNESTIPEPKETNEKLDKMPDQPANPQPQPEIASKPAEDKNQAPVKRFTQAEKLQTPTRKTSQPGTPGRKISSLGNGTDTVSKSVTNGSETPKLRPSTLATSAASPARRSSTPKVPPSSSKSSDGSKSATISPQSPISPISPISPGVSKSFLSSRKSSNTSSFSQSSKAKVITNGASNVLKSLMGKKKN